MSSHVVERKPGKVRRGNPLRILLQSALMTRWKVTWW
jgi:hypothetical protein